MKATINAGSNTLPVKGEVMQDEIKKTIYNPGLSSLDKLVRIARIIEGENADLDKIAEALGVPKTILLVEETRDIKKPVNKHREYCAVFMEAYSRMMKQEYQFTGIDHRQVKYLARHCELDDFRSVMNYLAVRWEGREIRKLEFEIAVVLNNLTPARVYKNWNLLFNNAKMNSGIKGKWGFNIDGKKENADE